MKNSVTVSNMLHEAFWGKEIACNKSYPELLQIGTICLRTDQASNLIAVVNQPFGKVAADKSCCAGNERFHLVIAPWYSADAKLARSF